MNINIYEIHIFELRIKIELYVDHRSVHILMFIYSPSTG